MAPARWFPQMRRRRSTDKLRAGRTIVAAAVERLFARGVTGEEIRRLFEAEGKTHLMDFRVNAAAYLLQKPNEKIRSLPCDQKPYWDVERARMGDTRDVPVEIVVNGKAVARQTLTADGKLHELKFEVPVK